MGRKTVEGVFFYKSFIEIIRNLDSDSAKGLFLAISDYLLNGTEAAFPTESPLNLLWLAIEPILTSTRTRQESGRMGGAPKGNTNNRYSTSGVQPKYNQSTTEVQAIKNKDKGNKEIVLKKVPPQLDDVKAYCKEKGLITDPEQFFNYYEANGWKVGKNPMKDWHAALRTWEIKEKRERGAQKPPQTEHSKFIRL